jgi:hypothetical protein
MNRIYLYNKVKRLKETQELETAITNIKYQYAHCIYIYNTLNSFISSQTTH